MEEDIGLWDRNFSETLDSKEILGLIIVTTTG